MGKILQSIKQDLERTLTSLQQLEVQAAREISGEFLKAKQEVASAIAHITAHLGRHPAV